MKLIRESGKPLAKFLLGLELILAIRGPFLSSLDPDSLPGPHISHYYHKEKLCSRISPTNEPRQYSPLVSNWLITQYLVTDEA